MFTARTNAESACHGVRYKRRRPEKSTLYRIVAEHAETVFAEAEASSERGGYPQYVKDEVAAFIRCGQLQHGFARFSCRACGEERLVAFSCKKRGLCPSCIAKRSALTAAHLCDAVLPVCPYRQWTLSLPYAFGLRLIRDGALFTKVIRTFVRTVFCWQRRKAKALGHRKVHCGSVTFAQRFGSLLEDRRFKTVFARIVALWPACREVGGSMDAGKSDEQVKPPPIQLTG